MIVLYLYPIVLLKVFTPLSFFTVDYAVFDAR